MHFIWNALESKTFISGYFSFKIDHVVFTRNTPLSYSLSYSKYTQNILNAPFFPSDSENEKWAFQIFRALQKSIISNKNT